MRSFAFFSCQCIKQKVCAACWFQSSYFFRILKNVQICPFGYFFNHTAVFFFRASSSQFSTYFNDIGLKRRAINSSKHLLPRNSDKSHADPEICCITLRRQEKSTFYNFFPVFSPNHFSDCSAVNTDNYNRLSALDPQFYPLQSHIYRIKSARKISEHRWIWLILTDFF